jgi:crotonobetainyl-CoA:carnitine CoA-transferase CaiB-like acyl-CoA transferase
MEPEKFKAPFDDLLIVDISGTIATGYAGKLFADYGSRVVNIEAGEGFSSRRLRPILSNGDSAMHGYLHANKESVNACKRLIDHPAIIQADLVLLDPFSLPSSISLEKIPSNVCAISWFGMHGPYSNYQGSDEVIHALTGLMLGIGEREGPPMIPRGYQAQILGGLSAFNGAVGYLMGIEKSKGKGEEASFFQLDASIFEANLYLTDVGAIMSFNDEPLPMRMGINRFAPTYPLGIWPCKDGWIGVTVLNPSQWKAFCLLLELEDLAEEPMYQSSMSRLEAVDIIEPLILEALSKWSAEELFYRGQKMRIPLARVPTMQELFEVDQYKDRKAFSRYTSGTERFVGPTIPYRLFGTPPLLGGDVAKLGADDDKWVGHFSSDIKKDPFEENGLTDCAMETETTSALPLTGIMIVDMSMGWAGPIATRNLADLGATVIKVESCKRFDWFRSWEATQEWIDDDGAEKTVRFVWLNRNKLGVTIDFETVAGRDLLISLIEKADAVVENYPVGILSKLDIEYSTLKKKNPELVMLSMPAFGSTGPWASFRAYGSTIEQAAGLPHLLGDEMQPPTMQHVAFGDAIAGVNGSAALLTALYHKKKTGSGQFLDLSQAECLLPNAIHGILWQSVCGEPPPRTGNDNEDYFLQGVFKCRGDDRWILIQLKTRDEFSRACDMIATLRDLITPDKLDAVDNSKKAFNMLADWTIRFSAADLMKELQFLGISAAKLNDPAGILADPHLAARGYMQFLERDFVGRQPNPSAPWRLGEKPLTIRSPTPSLGQHNKEIFSGLLGFSEEQCAALFEEGIIGTKPSLA